ncbi:MAG: RhuM family protein [Ferrovum myxofaciens]
MSDQKSIKGITMMEWQRFHFRYMTQFSVGHRVKSRQGTQFRIWATERVREYLVKGFT